MLRINLLLEHILQSATVVLNLQPVLRLHRIALAIHILGIEFRCGEKLGKAIQRRFQVSGIYIEKVVGVLKTGSRIVAATVLADKALVFTGIRIFLCAQEQHMLEKMNQPCPVPGILVTADIDIQGSRRLVRRGVGD